MKEYRVNHWVSITVANAGWLSVLLYTLICLQTVDAQTPIDIDIAPPPVEQAPGWTVLDRRQGQGEQCLVCDMQIFQADLVEIRYKGRTFHVKAGEMFGLFVSDPELYFRKLQAKAALFDESAIRARPMSTGWLVSGLYVLLGLVVGAACAYLALNKGLGPVPWFFAGLIVNVVAMAVLLTTQSHTDPYAPAGIPPGLAKVPTTHTPVACCVCGAPNHPSATSCTGCGATLIATTESELART